MDEILSNLIVIAITAIFVIGLFLYLNYRKKQEKETLIQFADEQGWLLTFVKERLVSGYRLGGETDGIHWSFESLSISQDTTAAPGSSETRMRIDWQCREIGLAEGVVAIGPRMAGAEIITGIDGFQGLLLQKVMKLIFGEDAGLVTGIKPVEYGSSAFQQQYMVWAHHQEDAERLLKTISETDLLRFKGDHRLLIKLDRTGLGISIPEGKKLPPQEVTTLVSLGVAMVQQWLRGG